MPGYLCVVPSRAKLLPEDMDWLAEWADQVVLAAYVKIVLNGGTVELPEVEKDLIARVGERNPGVV